MPLLFFAIAFSSGLANYLLGLVMGARLVFGHVLMSMLYGMAVTAAILGAVSPVALFLVLQAPAPAPDIVGLPFRDPKVAESMRVFWVILLLHGGAIGAAGIAGNLKLLGLLRSLCGSRRMAARVLTVWIIVCGFVGCELSWLFSPFLCKPNYPPHLIARMYFDGNFYEHVWWGLKELRK